MSVKDYISQKLQAFQLTESDYMNFQISSGISYEEDYTSDNSEDVNLALIEMIEWVMFSPRVRSINEGGFSISWDYEGLGKFYLWLCKKYGVTPNDKVSELLGISMIIDRTNIW